ncbi:hypothetical protein A6F65_01770 [Paraurantiacibacter namhicola]|uniref:Phosphodiester glycosidase domain-containing protein n=2 Tax=Paraurantiacibacter namhicola TaxID=645517 RepID=A0A1C7D9F9_9SPHN|nr:hypothetical protein A6F65_01770 [Paraurantiacibacter namhicola]
MRLATCLIPLALLACGEAEEPLSQTDVAPAASEPSACKPVVFEETPLTHCIAAPAKHAIAMDLGPDDGAPYRSLAGLAANRAPDAPAVAFAMNGGMYDEAGEPIGYYVEGGERLHELNRADGPGNFHLKPNGVFFGTGDTWRVLTSAKFYDTVSDRPEFGTQSGPMLVIDGELHPDFSEDGESKKTRNGVGVDAAGRAHFVISEAPVSFGKFARYFRDVAETPNALFLDGSVSQLWNAARGRMDNGPSLGPIIVVEIKE